MSAFIARAIDEPIRPNPMMVTREKGSMAIRPSPFPRRCAARAPSLSQWEREGGAKRRKGEGEPIVHQLAFPTISRNAAATPLVSSSVPTVMRSPCGRPWPGSQRTI